ncbi:MAG: pyruvate kinase [Negativicutes bacterium]|nr:pyruvate kinase [Negativicutes bacterium]
MLKKTKIVCTVGPSTDQPGILEKMLLAGMNIARFNFSHGSHEEHLQRLKMVRAAAASVKRPVGLMLDTKGPEVRLGKFAGGSAVLEANSTFVLTPEEIEGNSQRATVSYKQLAEDVQPGQLILLNDGVVFLDVEKVVGADVYCKVRNTSNISDRKRVAVPGVHLKLPPLSEQDIADLLFGVENEMDFVAASFIQHADDVHSIRKVLKQVNSEMLIISKIENAAGVKDIDAIISASDGIMVARGDLGVEVPTEDVPVIQKMVIQKANVACKPVITATQMLESMMTSPRPTRAEASDVANAIMDGTDAVMLSGESAAGKYPVEAVEVMAKIAMKVEKSLSYGRLLLTKGLSAGAIWDLGSILADERERQVHMTTTEAIGHATVQIAHELKAAAIVSPTETGYTPLMISKYRPRANIIGFTPYENIFRRLSLLWGVTPILGEEWKSTDHMVTTAISGALSEGAVESGDTVIITAGVPAGQAGCTNMIRVVVIDGTTLKGNGVGHTTAWGRACIAYNADDIKKKLKKGDILVVTDLDEEMAPYVASAAAIVAETRLLSSRAAISGINYGIPVILGVEGATGRLADGMELTVDASRGLVYQGK